MSYVLIVDDSDDMRDIIAMLLTKGDIRTKKASNGHEAIEMIREDRPAVMFCDLMMPEMDGFTLLAKIEKDETLPIIPTIILSAVGELVREDSLPGVRHVIRKGLLTTPMLVEVLKEHHLYEAVHDSGS